MTLRVSKVRRGLLLAGSAFLAIGALETGMRVLAPQDLSGWWMISHPSGLVLNRNEGSARHQFRDTIVFYTFDSDHNRRLLTPARAAQRRIVMLGDSFTFGWLLRDGDTFADRLQQAHQDTEFLNVAVGGWGTADHVKFIETFCAGLKPQAVYLFMNAFDIDRSMNSTLYGLQSDGTLADLPARKRWQLKYVLNGVPGYGWLLEHSHVAARARWAFLAARAEEPPSGSDAVASPTTRDHVAAHAFARALLLRLRDEIASCGSTLRVFFLGWHQPSPANANNLTLSFIEDAVDTEFFKRNGVAFHHLGQTPAMAKVLRDPASHMIPSDGHPNARGAEQIYLAIAGELAGYTTSSVSTGIFQ